MPVLDQTGTDQADPIVKTNSTPGPAANAQPAPAPIPPPVNLNSAIVNPLDGLNL